MLFSEIPGAENEKAKLIHQISSGKVPHAQMFLGNEGGPSLALALALATYLNCAQPGEKDACGTCPSCTQNSKLVHPDVQFIFPVSGTDKVTSDKANSQLFMKDWRAFTLSNPYNTINNWSETYGGANKQLSISRRESRNMVTQMSMKSFSGGYKIMIIWRPEFMHPSAANGILKLLEEPSPKTLFVLVAEDAERILLTIKSRVQILNVSPFPDETIQRLLQENMEANPEEAIQIARLSEGNLALAYQLINEHESNTHEFFREWMLDCYNNRFEAIIAKSDAFNAMTKNDRNLLLKYGLYIYRECLTLLFGKEELLKLQGFAKDFATKFANFMHLDVIEDLHDEFSNAIYHLERNANPRILFFDLSVKILKQIPYKK